MVISGKFKQSLGSLGGRLGSAAGEGLSSGFTTAFPKELERARLAQGLKQFEQESQGLSPLQQYTKLAAIPGITPQMIQALPEVLKQQQLGQALGKSQEIPAFPNLPQETERPGTSGLTTKEAQEALRKGFQRKTPGQIDARAAELYNSTPGRFKNNPELAIQYAQQEAAIEEAKYQDLLNKRTGEQNLQKNVQTNLQTQASLLKAQVPGNEYSDIEQRAVRSILPKEEGGEGLTDEEAKIKYGKELDKVSRDYEALSSIGNWSLPSQKPSDINRNINSLRNSFKERKQLENFADSLIGINGLSPSKAYFKAFKSSDIPELKKILDDIPSVKDKIKYERGFPEIVTPAPKENTIQKLAQNMGKEGSPLSIAEELNSKGYDPEPWLNYLDNNRKKLDLTERQIRELSKPRSFWPNLNDIWLFTLGGEENHVK